MHRTDDLRIREIKRVRPPRELIDDYPITETAADTVYHTRQAIQRILHGRDDRLLVVVGPCSVHDPEAALEYARRLKAVRERLAEHLLIVMRVYFEKPRTTIGWKGLINDPDLDGSFEINKGLAIARKLLLDLNNMGVPAGTEFLDLISPQYIADLISWGAIGARTTESQGHRELASGLSCPIGFKNATNGDIKVAIDAIHAAARPHVFMSVTKEGQSAIFSTTGNVDTHIILRGGQRPNYDTESVNIAAEQIAASGLIPKIMIDFSHANSGKRPDKQVLICQDVSGQIARGDRRIMGVMIESNLVDGCQNPAPRDQLIFGMSITDPCLGWEKTEPLFYELAEAVERRRLRCRGMS